MGSLSDGLLPLQHTQDSERLSQLAILASPKKLSPCQNQLGPCYSLNTAPISEAMHFYSLDTASIHGFMASC